MIGSEAFMSTSWAPLRDTVLARLMCPRCQSTGLRRIEMAAICQRGSQYSRERGIFDFDPPIALFPLGS